MTDFILRFIRIHRVEKFGVVERIVDKLPLKFTFSYYDTYAFLALTKKNILYLDEEVLKEAKLHNNKLFFQILHIPEFETFELTAIIYQAPFTKCIRIITAIKKMFYKYNVGSEIQSISHNEMRYTILYLTKLSS